MKTINSYDAERMTNRTEKEEATLQGDFLSSDSSNLEEITLSPEKKSKVRQKTKKLLTLRIIIKKTKLK